jgi:peptidoglycan/LPS O-acetylase OafA/YrhL
MAAGYRRIFGNTLRSANLGRNARHACLDVGLALLLPYFSVMRDRAGLCADGVRVVARLSYGLYLCHGLVLLALPKIFGRHALFTITKQTWSWCLSGWVLFFAVAWAVHRYFEKPIMDLRDEVSPPFYRRLSILAHTKLSLVRWTKR